MVVIGRSHRYGAGSMTPDQFRVALFSGNYNYTRDGANQSLNLLVGHLLDRGVAVRVYSPTSKTPAFPPVGDLVDVPSFPMPFRADYKLARGLPASVRADLEAFAPMSSMSRRLNFWGMLPFAGRTKRVSLRSLRSIRGSRPIRPIMA